MGGGFGDGYRPIAYQTPRETLIDIYNSGIERLEGQIHELKSSVNTSLLLSVAGAVSATLLEAANPEYHKTIAALAGAGIVSFGRAFVESWRINSLRKNKTELTSLLDSLDEQPEKAHKKKA